MSCQPRPTQVMKRGHAFMASRGWLDDEERLPCLLVCPTWPFKYMQCMRMHMEYTFYAFSAVLPAVNRIRIWDSIPLSAMRPAHEALLRRLMFIPDIPKDWVSPNNTYSTTFWGCILGPTSSMRSSCCRSLWQFWSWYPTSALTRLQKFATHSSWRFFQVEQGLLGWQHGLASAQGQLTFFTLQNWTFWSLPVSCR